MSHEWSPPTTDMQAFSKDNNGIKYLLTVIDIFSEFVWIVPLKRKTGQEIAHAFSKILRERKSCKVWVDKGKEFYNKGVQKLVSLYSTENEEKSCEIARFNRTIKEKCLSISQRIIQENISMYLTYLKVSIIIRFIHRLK